VHELAAGKRQRPAFADQQVVVGRRDVDLPRLGSPSLARQQHGQLGPPAEHLGDDGPVPRVEVLHDDHRHREVGRQAAEHPAKSRDTARGRRDRHNAVRIARGAAARVRRAHRGPLVSNLMTNASPPPYRWQCQA